MVQDLSLSHSSKKKKLNESITKRKQRGTYILLTEKQQKQQTYILK